MKYGSVCSGIEAATVAWHPLGFEPAWFAEIEKFPSAVLAHHYPDVPNLGDMTQLSRKVLSGVIEAPDILVGGTPCQAFSIAGLRQGLDDDRGQLTISYVRLADATDFIRQRRGEQPAIIVWENVPGVLSSKDNAFGCFLAALAGEDCEFIPPGKRWSDAGCVYGPQRAIAWRILDAQYIGLAQRRRRVFVVASARKGFDPAAVLFEREGVRRDSPPSRESGQNTTGSLTASAGRRGGQDEGDRGTLIAFGGNNTAGPIDVATAVRAKGGTGHNDFESETFIAECDVDTYNGALTGNIAHTLRDGNSEGTPCVFAQCVTGDITHTLKADGHDGSEDGTGRGTPIVVHGTQDPIIQYDQAHALGRNSGRENAVCFAIQAGALRENPNSGPDGIGVQANHAYTLEARAEVQAVAFAQNTRDEVREMPYAGALAAQPGMKQQSYIRNGMAVRRLMPIECERLQGFPDNYTLINVRGKPAADGPRYKAIGNSMAVPCMEWIGLRIVWVLDNLASAA